MDLDFWRLKPSLVGYKLLKFGSLQGGDLESKSAPSLTLSSSLSNISLLSIYLDWFYMLWSPFQTAQYTCLMFVSISVSYFTQYILVYYLTRTLKHHLVEEPTKRKCSPLYLMIQWLMKLNIHIYECTA